MLFIDQEPCRRRACLLRDGLLGPSPSTAVLPRGCKQSVQSSVSFQQASQAVPSFSFRLLPASAMSWLRRVFDNSRVQAAYATRSDMYEGCTARGCSRSISGTADAHSGRGHPVAARRVEPKTSPAHVRHPAADTAAGGDGHQAAAGASLRLTSPSVRGDQVVSRPGAALAAVQFDDPVGRPVVHPSAINPAAVEVGARPVVSVIYSPSILGVKLVCR